MMNLRIIMVMIAFLAGMLANSMLPVTASFETPLLTEGYEIASPQLEMPKDRISENRINVFSDRVVLDIQDAEWSTFTPTKSMVPVIDQGANAIQVKPQENCEDVEEGDIISYRSKYAEGTIIHRVIMSGEDEKGEFYIAKGDNNPRADPGKIRCDQILRVLVAIIY